MSNPELEMRQDVHGLPFEVVFGFRVISRHETEAEARMAAEAFNKALAQHRKSKDGAR